MLEKTEKYKKSLDAMLHISSMLSNLGYEVVERDDGYDEFGFYGTYSFGERNIHFRVKAGCCGNVFLDAGCYAENDFDVSMKMTVYDDFEHAASILHDTIKDFILSKRFGKR